MTKRVLIEILMTGDSDVGPAEPRDLTAARNRPPPSPRWSTL